MDDQILENVFEEMRRGGVTETSAKAWIKDFLPVTLIHADTTDVAIKKYMDDASVNLLSIACLSPDQYRLEKFKKTERLVLIAHENKIAYDAAIEMGAKLLRECSEIPPPLAWFLAAVIEGKASRPKKGNGKNYLRDWLICSMVEDLAVMGLNPTRNEATEGKKSGCDLVAEVLSEEGVIISADAVRKVWDKRDVGKVRAQTLPMSKPD